MTPEQRAEQIVDHCLHVDGACCACVATALAEAGHEGAHAQRADDLEWVRAFRRDCGCANAIEDALQKARLVTKEQTR